MWIPIFSPRIVIYFYLRSKLSIKIVYEIVKLEKKKNKRLICSVMCFYLFVKLIA